MWRRPVMVAMVLAVATCGLHAVLPADLGRDVLAVLLGALGGVYVGGALHRDRRAVTRASGGAAGCLVLAVVALRGPGWVLPAGFIAHGVWDWAHHAAGSRTVGRWWPPFCAAYDWLVGGYLLLALR